MQITNQPAATHEQLLRVQDSETGLTGFIAIHSTQLGPAAGGLRMRPYPTEAEAAADALRLAQGMTFKNAAAGLPLGGGKSVIMGNPADKTPDMLAAFGRAIETLAGRYWTAEDMGMSPADMAHVARGTRYVAGLDDGEFASGDPSPITARGIFNAIRVTARHRLQRDTLRGVHVAVQGLGHVGWALCGLLQDAGARLTVADISEARTARGAQEFGATVVAPDAILSVEADILAPCAIGGVLNTRTIPALQVKAVAGGANNQLATSDDGKALHARGILYAPDYVANAGGIINVATEILRIADRPAFVAEKLSAAEATLDAVLTQARAQNRSPADVADQTVATQMAARAA
ncbi:amino acid dehydrogenase [Actibacterium mucosum KCTC 23349]|uniref:Amino acid dehydrogenase n=1 Tax=Actibacterium mucosum KCTC 23349 TaxID=1454373 RepID=A0A037ZI75_9RHOB|nr:Glu/Leu/Phe/Val dehydrogenase dimerization domain-containing protein [Actibacterium mucosum]KAJ56150.1 amino acid dehydrogenase [Actibacterium mucosum KCTC 23349]